VPAGKCMVVLNYVDTGTFERRARKRTDGRFVGVYPGGLQWHQGLDIAIRAFARVKATMPNAELHIYGEGSEKDNLDRLIKELDLGNTVFIRPMVPHENVGAVIADADFGVVPKRADSFGNEAYSTKILEFMSQGIPVIASRTLIDTFYFREPAVKFFESGSEADLAEKILLVARDRDLCRRMVEASDAYLKENNWAARQQEYLDFVDGFADIRSDAP
jgi:glycosyltransferase involved in cell wall biosynthesis